MKSFALAAGLLLATANTAFAALKIHNWSNSPVYFWTGNDGNSRVVVPANSWSTTHNWIPGASVSLKFTNVDNFQSVFSNNILQFEYTLNDKLWYDLSNINGSPFFHGNVKVSPIGADKSYNTCLQLKCPANQVCRDAYNKPKDDWATHACQPNIGDVWLDIDEPGNNFNSRSVAFSA